MQDTLLNRREVLTSIAAAAALTALPRAFGAAPPGALDFLVVGDWGRDGTNHQREVAEQMGRTAESIGSRCVISVGDNFYEDGVQSISDPQWRSSFEEIYSAAPCKFRGTSPSATMTIGASRKLKSTTRRAALAGACRAATTKWRAPTSARRIWIFL